MAQVVKISFCLLYFKIGSSKKRATDWNTQRMRMRTPQPWGSALHNPEDPHSTTLKIWKRFYGSDQRE